MKKKGISRRSFLGLAGAAGATVTIGAGEKYLHKLIPYVNPPENIKPGEWSFYTTTCRDCPAGCGLLMWHRDGRITKAEGNPLHPLNRGKICVRGQASVQGEYHKERLTEVLRKNNGDFIKTGWNNAFGTITPKLENARNVIFISNVQTGSLHGVFEEFTAKYNTEVIYHEAFSYEAIKSAAYEVYGKAVIPRISIEDADLVLSFNAPFLETWLSPIEYAMDFGKLHSDNDSPITPFIYFGPSENMTSLNADMHIVTDPGKEAGIIYHLAKALNEKGRIGGEFEQLLSFAKKYSPEINEAELSKITELLMRSENPVIMAGNAFNRGVEDKDMVKASFILNDLLTPGKTNITTREFHALSKTSSIELLEFRLKNLGIDDVVVLHDVNLAYLRPDLKELLRQAGLIVYTGNFMNETADISDWVLPAHYYLEDWGDYETWKGRVSLMQPVMKPLYKETMSAGDIFLHLAGKPETSYKEIVRNNWRKWGGSEAGRNPDDFFREKIRQGYLDAEITEPEKLPIKTSITDEIYFPHSSDEFCLHIDPSLFHYDGQLSNRSWLQEIPHPLSNIAWGSWIDMNPSRAELMGIEDNSIVKLRKGEKEFEVPVRYSEKTSWDCISIQAGQGHSAYGKIAQGIGINAFDLVFPNQKSNIVSLEKTGKRAQPVILHPTKDQHDRELLKYTQKDELSSGSFEKDEITLPLPEGYKKEKDLYKPHEHKDHRWAMVIDLQKCIGCKACEAACYAENNIPVVGPDNVREGREMSWLKIVPYKIDGDKTAFLPLPCQHCDAAPCEPVCPVFASVHSDEGLNSQIYNRCIGTRYCSNNCPYKVRRFNWHKVEYPFPENVQLNPEVTVRERGVMEKCTFCVQRIRNAQNKALLENRELEEDEVIPACAQTCPTDAIVFGDLMDKGSRINQLINNKRRYQLLHEFNTKPAVIYLKKVNIKI